MAGKLRGQVLTQLPGLGGQVRPQLAHLRPQLAQVRPQLAQVLTQVLHRVPQPVLPGFEPRQPLYDLPVGQGRGGLHRPQRSRHKEECHSGPEQGPAHEGIQSPTARNVKL